MAYDPNSPATTHAGLSDCDKIRTNCNELRKFEASATEPSNPVAGMIWLYTPGSGDWILKERNKTNDGWIDMITVTSAGSPKAHIETNITESVSAHGIQQGSGNNFNADKLDGKHAADLVSAGKVANEYIDRNGTNAIAANDVSKNVENLSYTLQKKFKLYKTPDSTLKIYFVLTGHTNSTIYGKIYRNGSPVGTERSKGSGSEGFTEEIAGWQDGDTLELWAYVTVQGYQTPVSNFRILGTRRINNDLE